MFRCILLLSVLKNCQSLIIPSSRDLLEFNEDPPPDYFDWRLKNKVSPVKNQGQCNACWAFSIVGTIESHASIHLPTNRILSEQFLIDCLPTSQGCAGQGVLETYADLVTRLGYLIADKDYFPYSERKEKCRSQKDFQNSTSKQMAELAGRSGQVQLPIAPYKVYVSGFKRIENEDQMAMFIVKYGPLTAGINPASMMKYPKGKPVIDEPSDADCDPENLHHSVVVVGYGRYDDSTGRRVKYWIIKNSWGEDWGDEGYYYLVRGRNACGIANDVSVPFIT